MEQKSIGRWSSPGSPWDAALAPRVFRGCAGMFLGYGYGSLLCSGGDHWVVLGGRNDAWVVDCLRLLGDVG